MAQTMICDMYIGVVFKCS